jgi:hypothetical protein
MSVCDGGKRTSRTCRDITEAAQSIVKVRYLVHGLAQFLEDYTSMSPGVEVEGSCTGFDRGVTAIHVSNSSTSGSIWGHRRGFFDIDPGGFFDPVR